ncbi:MAG: peptidyl-alpha-hydroxyglycine alpha-amidating lyase family protein [Sphingomonadaceae bacterium]
MKEMRYEVVEGWEKIPPGYVHRDVVGVAVDSRDRVYLLTRNDARVMVYEPDGTFVTSWAEGTFTGRTHGIRIGPDDVVYCVDDRDHTVRKFSPTGELLMTIGTVGVASDTGYDASLNNADLWTRLNTITHGGPPFNRPTNVAIAPNGDLYVSDGYANARVHRFSADGRLIQSWGEPGTGPGQFHLVHDVWVTHDGRVLVADRENDRIQIFSLEGEFLDQWTHVQRPTGIYQDRDGLIYVSELSRRKGMLSYVHGPAPEDQAGRVCILDPEGKVLHRWGTLDRTAPGQFCAPHCICVDSRGDIYVGEVTWTDWGSKGLVPPDTHMFQKFARKW